MFQKEHCSGYHHHGAAETQILTPQDNIAGKCPHKCRKKSRIVSFQKQTKIEPRKKRRQICDNRNHDHNADGECIFIEKQKEKFYRIQILKKRGSDIISETEGQIIG